MNEWEKPDIKHGELTKFNYIVQYPENLELGTEIDIGTFSYINSEFGVIIRNFVKIGSHCSIYSNSTIDKKNGQVVIEENCKIGSHSTIMPGITIGKNSIIAAHSFVNRSIPSNEIWGGVPVKFIKKIQ